MKINLLLLLLLAGIQSFGQRISFKSYVQSEAITLNLVENQFGLNFNNKQALIVAGDPAPVLINLMDAQAVVLEIEAPIEYDLTLEVTSSLRFSIGLLDTGITVPFNVRYAYNNTGETSPAARKIAATEVPPGYNVVTLPMRRQQPGGPPAPPPTPDHDGFVRQRGKIYVYFYGALGPVPSAAPTGLYEGEIQVNVNYSDNAF